MLEALNVASLIFGGCCSNVYALEAVLKREPSSGLLLTFFQFFFATLASYPSQFSSKHAFFIKPPSVPMHRWVVGAAMFFTVNMLNNWAFAFDISVPLHILLRSFGSVTTMVVGWCVGKHYTNLQWLSVLILTAGVVISAWADALGKGKDVSASSIDFWNSSFEAGLLILLAAQILSAVMGIYVQNTYERFGKHWVENLFYEHLLSLPLFMPFASSLQWQYQRLHQSPPLRTPPGLASRLPDVAVKAMAKIPQSIFFLFMNSFTQLLCISGVNLLGAKSSAVTVTVVLNVRKLVSFMLSCWLFGNTLTNLMLLGSGLVFGAGALYGWETSIRSKRRSKTAVRSNGSSDVKTEKRRQ